VVLEDKLDEPCRHGLLRLPVEIPIADPRAWLDMPDA
jgi:hypothetical protein